jgi:ferric-dicitrate binding protein FerR (iron transport regulator)
MNSIPIEQIIAFLENKLSADEKQNLESWIAETEENRIQFKEVKKLSENSRNFRVDFQPNPQKALEKVNRVLNRKRFIHWSQRAAAAILFIFLITKLFFLISPKTEWIEITAQAKKEILLPDSSKVILVKNTNFKYPQKFVKQGRNVFLKGQAYFEIQPNKKQPFVVNTANTKTIVLGTKFLINATNIGSEHVIVDEGKVSFSPLNQEQNNKVYLTKNEIGTWNAGNSKIIISEVAIRNVNSWLSGTIKFKDNSLLEVINDFKRIYHMKIELAEKDFEFKKYTGTFNNSDPEKALETVATTFNLLVEKRDNTYILTK